ncbi:lymphatic vessel endothelial hyaluronic acid receptor 1a [Syngnathus typhle]|uniref:lymphatic vessel endothelial hyaluronic acid receptor 1a n=1 Tax=Syngnathus typhle TaxID=161592 RepID=UPI002A6A60CB|nr:lymphatic vessel endothelial hyaluronic acid receptor 1a [Syngnathus typhle]
MKSLFISLTVALFATAVFSQQNITINLRVFPAKSIAGVVQLSLINDQNQTEYAFNVTEARDICTNIGFSFATKDQVNEALNRGLETCRFGWIDEHYAVIPRIKALKNCGQNQVGLLPWRAALDKKFDVFCFIQSEYTEQDPISPTPSLLIVNLSLTPDLSVLESLDVSQFARLASNEQSSGKRKVVLISSVCVVLLVAIAVFAYMKVKRQSQRADVIQECGDVIEIAS